MRNQLNTRHLLAFVVLCLLLGACLLFIHTWRRTSPHAPPEQGPKVTAPQEAMQGGRIPAEPPQGTLDGKRPTEVSVNPFPVSPPPAQLLPSQLPPTMPAASQLPSEAEQKKEWLRQEEERIENLTAGMDAFTAAKFIYELNRGREGRYAPYIRELTAQALAENPNDFDTILLWTRLQPRKSYAHNPERETGYRKLLEMDPNSVSALVGLGAAIYWVQPEEAIEHLEKAKLQNPSLANAYLGFAYQRVGDYDKALEILKARPENDIVAQAHRHGIESGEPYIPPIHREISPQQEHSGEDSTFRDVPLNPNPGLSTETETLQHSTPEVRTEDTSGGFNDADIDAFFENMTAQKIDALEQFIRDEFPEYARFLDEEPEISEGRSRQEIEAEVTPNELRDAYQTLEKYGPNEGLKQLQAENPRLARKIARELKRHKATSRRKPLGESKRQSSTSSED